MSVELVYVKNFRNLVEQKFRLNEKLNFFVGDNGSGKSSILEAIFFVGHGKSFRTTKPDTICHFDKEEFFINIRDELANSVGLTKHKHEQNFVIKRNNKRLNRLSELANDFAIQIVTPESFKLFFGGAKERRRFLDLGLFHVEHSFVDSWKKFSKIHKQRNAVIRSRLNDSHFDYWTNEFVQASELVSSARASYTKQLGAELALWLEILLPEVKSNIEVSFFQGWSKAKSLAEVLADQKEREFQLGYSSAGAHKFDLRFFVDGKPLELKLSRGQQKLFLIALTFAQMKLIERVKQLKAILLIDDFGAELDVHSRTKLSYAISKLNCQIVISAIDMEALKPLIKDEMVDSKKNYTMFHVEHGEILE